MADRSNVEHFKRTGQHDKARALTAPKTRSRGGGGGSPRGHMAVGGETISHHIASDLPRRSRNKLFNFGRPHWSRRKMGW